MDENGIAERLRGLEVMSQNTKEQLSAYISDHKETHKQDKEKMDTISTVNAEILSKLNNRGSFYMMVATLIAALFAGISPIAVSLINAGVKP